ncbi:hypothetical protein EZV62_009642 [Acer yangbiense]|uniref:Uncharacterized protein n=1 Tax=Acer yangbiense TaxID=1000413 RepID=A0A5C7I143_9ROSI|nr:hypothetical protein EZV62_009642 [Acer yangbiense]
MSLQYCIKVTFSVCTTSMNWWIPRCAYMKHNASNQTISLKGIPRCVNNESVQERKSSPTPNSNVVH